MALQLLHPQEIEYHYILPSIRKHISIHLKEQGLDQKKIASLLHIRESTVSQYINNKRANKIDFNPIVKSTIKESASKIKNRNDLIRETQNIIAVIRKCELICDIHRKFVKLPDDCNLCEACK
jgi:predicted transcriptional regulator|tara:strand:+ start:13209 stop:13577 length:369 start_codon:yes stop_codon:yes gene_type:complete